MVFIDRRPNAVVVTCAMYIALATVIITAIVQQLQPAWSGTRRRSGVRADGGDLLGVALLTMRLVIPGNFHEHVDDPELHPASFAVALILLAVGGVTAAAVS